MPVRSALMIFSFSMCLVAPWRRATALMGRASSDTRSAHAEALVSVLPSRSSSTMAQASPVRDYGVPRTMNSGGVAALPTSTV